MDAVRPAELRGDARGPLPPRRAPYDRGRDLPRAPARPRVLGIDLGSSFFKPALHADVLRHEGLSPAPGSPSASSTRSVTRRRTPDHADHHDRPRGPAPHLPLGGPVRSGPRPRSPPPPRPSPRGPASTCGGSRRSTSPAGAGARVWDVDGNEYLDFSMARRAAVARLLLPRRRRRDSGSSSDGITFSLMHPLEVEVAELVREVVPGAEMRALRQDRLRRHQRRRPPRASRDRARQGALLRLPRLARLVHRLHRPRGRDPGRRARSDCTVPLQRPRGRPRGARRRDRLRDPRAHDLRGPEAGLPRGPAPAPATRRARCSSSTRCGPASGSRSAAPRSSSA